jgi:sugar/nucleoside kinase (ribokinase family)
MLQYDLIGVGNPVYDTIITPRTRTDGRVLSGCSTNACLAAKRLGMKKVGLVGCIGRDFAGRFSRDMARYGVEAETNEGIETGGFHLVYGDDGNRTLDVLGVAGQISPKNFPEKFLDSKFILIGPILGEVSLELVEYIRGSSSATLFLDPQGLIRTIGEDKRIIHRCNAIEFKKLVELVDFVKPNEYEVETITGVKDPARAICRLREFGGAVPIVTLAERGSLLLDGNRLYRIPPYATSAVDPTGAGDVYAGSFITEYERTDDLSEETIFASAAASIKVEQVGPDFQLRLGDVELRKKVIRDKLSVEAVPW